LPTDRTTPDSNAPESAALDSTTQNGATQNGSADAASSGAPDAAPAPRRRRAARRPVSSAVSTEPTADGDTPPAATAALATPAASAPVTDTQTDSSAADAEAPAAPARTRRAPRKTAAKKAAPAVVEATAELELPEDVAAASVDTPAAAASDDASAGPQAVALDADTEAITAPAEPDAATEPVTEPVVAEDAPAPRTRRRRAVSAPLFQAAEPVAVSPVDLEESAPADEALDASVIADDENGAAENAGTDNSDNSDTADSDDDEDGPRRRRRRGRRGRGRGRSDGEPNTGQDADGESDAAEGDSASTRPASVNAAEAGDTRDADDADDADESDDDADGDSDGDESGSTSSRRRRRRRRGGGGGSGNGPEATPDDPPNTVVKVREPREPREPRQRRATGADADGVRGVTGSTRLEAKRQRRRDGRGGSRRAPIITEAEFLARRESVEREMIVRNQGERTQIAVLEDGVLVEHYVTRASATAFAGNVYVGKVQNVLPSMEAAFIDIGKGRNAVLYAGEVNYDAAGFEGNRPRSIEQALKSGQNVLVQVSKDPIGHKGARLTSQITLPGRYLVYVPEGSMTGISRKLPDTERARLKAILKKIVPEEAGVIIRTAAEGATEEELTRDVERLAAQWEEIKKTAAKAEKKAPALVHAEPDLVVRVVRDVFNEDFTSLVVQGEAEWEQINSYVTSVAPELMERVSRWNGTQDVFSEHRVDEQLVKALDRKVHLPSGGSLVIDRTEAMTVVDVNTGKFTGKGGNLEETVTKNNLEAAEEIVRQLRLRDVGGIIVIDFIDMVLESNRELVLRRLTECLGRDRTRHQVAEVTSLGLVQMTRKRVGTGLLEAYSEVCAACNGRGVLIHLEGPPAEHRSGPAPVSSKPIPRPPIAPKARPEVESGDNSDGSDSGASEANGAGSDSGSGAVGIAASAVTEESADAASPSPFAPTPSYSNAASNGGTVTEPEIAPEAVADAEEPVAKPAPRRRRRATGGGASTAVAVESGSSGA
jgi:ribonuclease E